MQIFGNQTVYSATDLSSFVHCGHLLQLRRHKSLRLIRQPVFDDPAVEALARRGIEHEKSYLAKYADLGLVVVEIEQPTVATLDALTNHATATIDAMRAGADVIYQGAFFDGIWLGKPDFVVKVPGTSAFGDYAYEIVDAKLAREAKATAVLQILLYAELLKGVQGSMPERVALALAGPEAHTEYFRVADYEAYYRSVRRRFDSVLRGEISTLHIAPDPVDHCGVCAWSSRCGNERTETDHLSLVAGISRKHVALLRGDGVTTLAALGNLDAPGTGASDITSATFERIQNQARVQLEGRMLTRNVHELLPIVENQGLAGLPAPSEGDIYFDLESDNNAFTWGIEYLFGYSDRNGAYTSLWALNPEQEKVAFETFVDMIVARRKQYPGMHVYHYSAHETTALKSIMSRYGTRENEIDDLLRGETFVDLLRIVKQSMRASVVSYSIKKMEPFYDFKRQAELSDARRELARFELWLEFGDNPGDLEEIMRTIRTYNRDDCDSMLFMQNWLEKLRAGAIEGGADVPRPLAGARVRAEEERVEDEALVALRSQLLDGVPLNEQERTADQHAKWLLGNLLGFYKREEKTYWWSFFDRLDMSDAEATEDGEAIGGLQLVEVIAQKFKNGNPKPSLCVYRFDPQEHGFKAGTAVKRKPRSVDGEPVASSMESVGTVAAVDEVNHTITISRKDVPDHPTSIVPHNLIPSTPQIESIRRTGERCVASGLGDDVASQLLLRARPRLHGNAALRHAGEDVVTAGKRLVLALDRTVLPIQGPPGAGKTYLGARMILEAVAAGKRVGLTAPSHAVITNLIDEVFRAAREEHVDVGVCQKPGDDGVAEGARAVPNAAAVLAALQSGTAVAAGTAWLWASEDMQASVDILFIDEGGQFSLANALAVAPAAGSIVILGDPQQLDQVRKGVHPSGCELSALDHLCGGGTIDEDRGLFMEQTWRLHPGICSFTSEIFYGDRLLPRDDLHNQSIVGDTISGSGLRLIIVPHSDNQNESVEEARAIRALLDSLVDSHWIDRKSARAPLGLNEVVIVAAYNAQVDRIRKEVRDGTRVGTVDKFQGQEAPISIYSLASSSAADAPRGMQFLFSPKRFNVATSRGRCLAIVVASPDIFTPECQTPEQMRYANAFCRFQELATLVSTDRDRSGVQPTESEPRT